MPTSKAKSRAHLHDVKCTIESVDIPNPIVGKEGRYIVSYSLTANELLNLRHALGTAPAIVNNDRGAVIKNLRALLDNAATRAEISFK